MRIVTAEQRALIVAIQSLFGNDSFDTTSVAGKTCDHPELVAAIEAALLGRRWWKKRGGIVLASHGALRCLLTRLAKQHFVTDEYHYRFIAKTKTTGDVR